MEFTYIYYNLLQIWMENLSVSQKTLDRMNYKSNIRKNKLIEGLASEEVT